MVLAGDARTWLPLPPGATEALLFEGGEPLAVLCSEPLSESDELPEPELDDDELLSSLAGLFLRLLLSTCALGSVAEAASLFTGMVSQLFSVFAP